MSTNIPTFLPNWDLILADDFQGKWWVNDTEHSGNWRDMTYRQMHWTAGDLWPEHASPFGSHELQKIDAREEELLKMLEDGILELEQLDNKVNHSWGRAMKIRELLGLWETASQP
ncbi:hypothetical protein PAXRUDRAFT_177052 [Paxillus rubicundulus Ve08.2h10]|uniref:Uncharacterized protein n=1 Tax=Paxillus rubicundulus Ve08.2h10 TaxID=930991 RepID=A0A0D0BR49_9AGAM|nr:hypothetical protein PAXRUDRAFT_177052 [Paxillus rubicundulus Ve08.2h10]